MNEAGYPLRAHLAVRTPKNPKMGVRIYICRTEVEWAVVTSLFHTRELHNAAKVSDMSLEVSVQMRKDDQRVPNSL